MIKEVTLDQLRLGMSANRLIFLGCKSYTHLPDLCMYYESDNRRQHCKSELLRAHTL